MSEFDDVLQRGQEIIDKLRAELKAFDNIMPTCGHKQRYVVSSDEGTSYCMECALEAEVKANAELRADLDKANEYGDEWQQYAQNEMAKNEKLRAALDKKEALIMTLKAQIATYEGNESLPASSSDPFGTFDDDYLKAHPK